MTPKQLQKLLDENGLSQRGAARQLGIDERTMRRYAAGDAPIPPLVEFGLMALVLTRTDPRRAAKEAVRARGADAARADVVEVREWLKAFQAGLREKMN